MIICENCIPGICEIIPNLRVLYEKLHVNNWLTKPICRPEKFVNEFFDSFQNLLLAKSFLNVVSIQVICVFLEIP
jgi:hypothetical protein